MPKPVEMTVHPEKDRHTVSPFLYSQFAEHLGRCIYEGVWVGEDSEIPNEDGIRLDTVAALKKLKIPALRWPGGCFADNYHWRDGIGPRKKRPKRHNLWWNQPESNQFGTDEFMRLCGLIDTEPYICLNVGSGTVDEARSWVEYCNSDWSSAIVDERVRNGHPEPYGVKFWGIGNENWGCGGNMRPEHYADLYRQFATYVRNTAGNGAKLVACGSHQEIPEWDERFLKSLKDFNSLGTVDYLALHIYNPGGSDTKFSDKDYAKTIEFVDLVEKTINRAIDLVRSYSSSGHKIGVVLDEWGLWYAEPTTEHGSFQQNTMRDALYAAACFHRFHRQSDWLYMTNMAQTINVLQALVLTRNGEMTVTPTYHVYDMFRPHRSGILVESEVRNSPSLDAAESDGPKALSLSATKSQDGKELFLSVLNLDLDAGIESPIRIDAATTWEIEEIRRLVSGNIRDHNTFENPDQVKPIAVSPEQAGTGLRIEFPAHSITTIRLKTV